MERYLLQRLDRTVSLAQAKYLNQERTLQRVGLFLQPDTMYCTSPRRDGNPCVHSLGSACRGPDSPLHRGAAIDTGIYHTLAQWHIGCRVSNRQNRWGKTSPRVQHYLEPGRYLGEARLKRPNTASRDRKLILQWEGVPHSGAHQSDHTVAYRMGTTTTDQNATGDLARAALPEGAKEWNKAGGATSTWPFRCSSRPGATRMPTAMPSRSR